MNMKANNFYRASDGINSVTGVMTINLADIIDEDPVLSATSYSSSIAETSAIGTSITLSPALTVTDTDNGDIATYSLSGMF